MPDNPISTTPTATYAELATERRSIVLREDSDWDRYGFTGSQAAAWIANGIPADHAPLAAVARDITHFPSATPLPELLRRDISGRSILDMLLDGMDSGAIERQITSAIGQDIDGSGDSMWRRAALGSPSRVRIKPPLATRLRGTDKYPSRVPEVLDAIGGWFDSNVGTFYGNSVIATDAYDYVHYGQTLDVLPKLSNYLAAHGIAADDDETIRRLIAATPMSQGVIDMVPAGAALFSGVVDRVLFHLDAAEHRALREAMREYEGSALEPARLPAADGFVYLAGDTETGLRPTIFAWTSTLQGASLTTAHVALTDALAPAMRSDVMPIEELRVARVDFAESHWAAENEWAADAFAMLVAFADHMEARSLADFGDEPRDPQSKTRGRHEAPTKRRDVNLVYRRKTPIAPAMTGTQPREWTHRWPVRGFQRRQWYPSLGEHRLIWVAPHERGPKDAPLIARRQVHVVNDQG